MSTGWYYDPRQSHFANVFHLYMFLLLLAVPLSIAVLVRSKFEAELGVISFTSNSFALWITYCIVICVLFVVIKLINVYLHKLFDAGECVVEDDAIGELTGKHQDLDIVLPPLSRGSSDARRRSADPGSRTTEAIEMVVLNDAKHSTDGKSTAGGDSNDIDAYFRKINFNESVPGHSSAINFNPSCIDLEVDVHHRNSSGSSLAAAGSISSASVGSGRLREPIATTLQSDKHSHVTVQQPAPTFTTFEPKPSTSSDHSGKEVSAMEAVAGTSRDQLDATTSSAVADFSTVSLSVNSSQEMTTQSFSSEALLTPVNELGFMAQDPHKMREHENTLRTFKGGRQEAFAGRRARSELETTNYDHQRADKTGNEVPSHPVSLEVITQAVGDTSGSASSRPSNNQKSCRFASAEILSQRQNASQMSTAKSASVLQDIKPIAEDKQEHAPPEATTSEVKPESDSAQLSPEAESTVAVVGSEDKDEVSSSEGKDSDSLITKDPGKRKKHGKARAKKPFRARISSAPTTSGVVKSGKTTSVPACYEEHSTSSSEATWTSKSRGSVSISSSDTHSDDEQTPLTSSMAAEGTSSAGNKLAASLDRSEELKKRICEILAKSDLTECERELKKLRAEINTQRRKRQQLKKLQEHEQARLEREQERPETSTKGYQPLTSETGALVPSGSTTEGPPAYLLARILSTPGTHLAFTHDDTTTGAVHCFQDEFGNWLTYTFDEHSMGIARGLNIPSSDKVPFEVYATSNAEAKWGSSSSSSASEVVRLDQLHVPAGRRPSTNEQQVSNHNLARFLASSANDNCLFQDFYSSEYYNSQLRNNLIVGSHSFSILAEPTIAAIAAERDAQLVEQLQQQRARSGLLGAALCGLCVPRAAATATQAVRQDVATAKFEVGVLEGALRPTSAASAARQELDHDRVGRLDHVGCDGRAVRLSGHPTRHPARPAAVLVLLRDGVLSVHADQERATGRGIAHPRLQQDDHIQPSTVLLVRLRNHARMPCTALYADAADVHRLRSQRGQRGNRRLRVRSGQSVHFELSAHIFVWPAASSEHFFDVLIRTAGHPRIRRHGDRFIAVGMLRNLQKFCHRHDHLRLRAGGPKEFLRPRERDIFDLLRLRRVLLGGSGHFVLAVLPPQPLVQRSDRDVVVAQEMLPVLPSDRRRRRQEREQ